MPRSACVCGATRRVDGTCNTPSCSNYRPSRRGAAVITHNAQYKLKVAAEVLDKKPDKEAVDVDAWVTCTKRLVAMADISRGSLLACGFSTDQISALQARGNVADLMLPGSKRRLSPAPACRQPSCVSPKKFAKVAKETEADPWERVVALCKRERSVGACRAALKG